MEASKHTQSFLIYKWLLAFLFIHSMYFWPTWGIEIAPLVAVVFAVTLYVMLSESLFYMNKGKISASFAFTFLILWMAKGSNFFGFIHAFADAFVVTSIICLKDNYKVDAVAFITRVFAIIMLMSMIGYMASLFGVAIPSTMIEYNQYTLENHYFYVSRPYVLFSRFQGPFLEPGHVSMGLAPILFANRYNLKDKYVLILFIAQLLTLSLAGYITLIVGYGLQFLFNKETTSNKFISTAIGGVLLLLMLSFFRNVYMEDTFEQTIIERLQWEDGKLAGDNRSGTYLDQQFQEVINSSDIITGRDFNIENSDKGVSGYKLFIVKFGLVGVFLTFWAYTSILTVVDRKNRLMGRLFLLLLFMLLVQNAYPTWWCMIISLVCGTKYLEYGRLAKSKYIQLRNKQ